jgi:hypothetical protein
MSIILNSFSAFLDLFDPANTQGYGNTSSNGITYGLLFILIFFVIAVAVSVHKHRKRERKYFSAEVKRATLKNNDTNVGIAGGILTSSILTTRMASDQIIRCLTV